MSRKNKKTVETGEAVALDIPAEEISAPTETDVNDLTERIAVYRARVNGLGLTARLIAGIGSFVCLLGVAAYAIISLPTVLNVPFEWKYVYYTAGAWVLFLILGLIFGIAKAHNARILKNLKKARASMRASMEAAAVAAPAEESPVCGECDEAEAVEAPAEEASDDAASVDSEPVAKKNALMVKLQAQIDKLPEKVRTPVNKAVSKVSALPKKAVIGAGSAVAALVVALGTASAIKAKKKKFKKTIRGTFTVHR